AQAVKIVIFNCLNDQEYVDVPSENTTALVKLLKVSSHNIVSMAMKMDHHSIHCYAEKGIQGMELNTPAIAVVLVDILRYEGDLKTTKHASKWLQCLSRNPAVLLRIYQSNGIPVLVKLLSIPEESVSFYAVKTLQNLLLYQEGSKAAVCKVNGLQKMVILLKNNNDKFLSVVIDCLRILAFQNQKNKLLIFSCNGPAELIRIMKAYSFNTLLCSTLRVLRSLSFCSSNKLAIIAADGVQILARHLNNPRQKLFVDCLFILRNLSDEVAKQGYTEVASILPILIQHLGSSDENIVCCTAGILYNFTCNNPYNKVIVYQEKGIHALLNVILKAGNDEEIIEPAIGSLRNLTHKHPEAEAARNDVRLLSRLEMIVKFLKPSSSWSLIEAVIGLLRNLILCPNNHEPLIALGTVYILKDMLRLVYQDILRNREIFSHDETQPNVIEGIKMEYIVEDILIIFLELAPNVKVGAILKEPAILNTFHQISNKETEKLRNIISGIFAQIFFDTNSTLAVESVGDIPLLHSSFCSNTGGVANSMGVELPHQHEFSSTISDKITQKDDCVPSHEVLQNVFPSVISESNNEESQSFFCYSSVSRHASNQCLDLQPEQNSGIQDSKDVDIPQDLNIVSTFKSSTSEFALPFLARGGRFSILVQLWYFKLLIRGLHLLLGI
ncbi:unnamed protein product, partial [Larinioides sclopetarius]